MPRLPASYFIRMAAPSLWGRAGGEASHTAWFFLRSSFFQYRARYCLFHFFLDNHIFLSLPAFHIVTAIIIPTFTSTKKKCFLSIKTLFLLVVTYLHSHNLLRSREPDPQSHVQSKKKKKTIHILFIGKYGSAEKTPSGLSFSTTITFPYRYPTGRLPSSFLLLPS